MMSKKNRRRGYLKYYKKNADGSYTYQGNFYQLKEQAGGLLQIKLRLWIFCGAMIAALLLPGFLNVPGLSRCAYVIIPYAAALIAGVSAGWALFRFCTEGYPVREYVYLETISRLPGRACVCALGTLLAAGGEIIFLVTAQANARTAEAFLFLASGAAAFVCALLLWRGAKNLLAEMTLQK